MRAAVFAAEYCMAFDHAGRANSRARTNLYMRADDRVRTDFDGFVELRARLDDRGRVNLAHAPSLGVLLLGLPWSAAPMARPASLRVGGRVFHGAHQFGFGRHRAVHFGTRAELPDAEHAALEVSIQGPTVTGL